MTQCSNPVSWKSVNVFKNSSEWKHTQTTSILWTYSPSTSKNRRPNEKQQHQGSTAALNAGCKWSRDRWRHLSNSFVGFTTDQHHSLISGLTPASSAKRLTVENELVSCFSPSLFWDLLFYALFLLTLSLSFLSIHSGYVQLCVGLENVEKKIEGLCSVDVRRRVWVHGWIARWGSNGLERADNTSRGFLPR